MNPERLAFALAAVALAFIATAIHALVPADPSPPRRAPLAHVAAPPAMVLGIDDPLDLHEAFDDVADLGVWHTDRDPAIDATDEHAAASLPVLLGGPGWVAVTTGTRATDR